MEYRIPLSHHDSTICQEIGEALGQTPGDWSIGHRQEGDEMVLLFPSNIVTNAQVKAVVDVHEVGKLSPPSRYEILHNKLNDDTIVFDELKELLRLERRKSGN